MNNDYQGEYDSIDSAIIIDLQNQYNLQVSDIFDGQNLNYAKIDEIKNKPGVDQHLIQQIIAMQAKINKKNQERVQLLLNQSALVNENKSDGKQERVYTHWTHEESLKFIQALEVTGRKNEKMTNYLQKHGVNKQKQQVISHSQKFFNKLKKIVTDAVPVKTQQLCLFYSGIQDQLNSIKITEQEDIQLSSDNIITILSIMFQLIQAAMGSIKVATTYYIEQQTPWILTYDQPQYHLLGISWPFVSLEKFSSPVNSEHRILLNVFFLTYIPMKHAINFSQSDVSNLQLLPFLFKCVIMLTPRDIKHNNSQVWILIQFRPQIAIILDLQRINQQMKQHNNEVVIMTQQESAFQQLFFKVQPVAEKKQYYNPVQRKIIDVNVYERDKLVYSSVASVYLYQEKYDMLVEERKQQKQSILRTERPLLSFPIPRLPKAFIQQIKSQPIRDAFLQYIDMLPPQLQVKATQQCEDQPFYQRLDQNQVPNVQTVLPMFSAFYRNLCKLYLAEYSDQNSPMDAEAVDALNFYRFTLQIPYIPPFSVWARPVLKIFRYMQNNALKIALKELFKVETLQQSLQIALTRRWQRDLFSKYVDGEDVETEDNNLEGAPGQLDATQTANQSQDGLPEATVLLRDLSEGKTYENSTDLLFSHVFQFTRILINCQLIPARFAGTLYSLFLGSQCYNFQEIKHFLIKKDGFMKWMQHKNDDLTHAFKAGITAKVLAAIENYSATASSNKSNQKNNLNTELHVINQSKQMLNLGDEESDMLAVDADKNHWDGLYLFLQLLNKLLKLKLVSQRGFVLRVKDRGINILNKIENCSIDDESQKLAGQCISQLQRLG